MTIDLRTSISAIRGYYRTPAVLARILEFCGVPPKLLRNISIENSEPLTGLVPFKELLGAATAEYISAYGLRLLELTGKDHCSMKTYNLGWALDNALDIHRSVWDRDNFVGVLDMEYFSKAFPGESYLAPERIFTLLEPVYRCTSDILAGYGIPLFANTTGQGYNFGIFVSKENRAFPVINDILEMGHLEQALEYDYGHPSPKRGHPVPEEDGKAFDVMGKVCEFLCHRIRAESLGQGLSIPVVVGDIVCGNEKREAISLDLSLYVNPLHTRSIRFPFSVYSKHLLKTSIIGEIVARNRGYLFCIPRSTKNGELSLFKILQAREDIDHTIKLAKTTDCCIPDHSEGFSLLLKDYKTSALYSFHHEYDAVEQDDRSVWPQSYDRFDLNSIPPCAAQLLSCPNPLLLQPTGIRHIVRVLMAMGWHPKHIAGLAYSKYVRDYGWEVNFKRYDPLRWATVWVRIYAGMILLGADELMDLNCVSQQEKGDAWMGFRYCPNPWCGFNLADYRDALLRRI